VRSLAACPGACPLTQHRVALGTRPRRGSSDPQKRTARGEDTRPRLAPVLARRGPRPPSLCPGHPPTAFPPSSPLLAATRTRAEGWFVGRQSLQGTTGMLKSWLRECGGRGRGGGRARRAKPARRARGLARPPCKLPQTRVCAFDPRAGPTTAPRCARGQMLSLAPGVAGFLATGAAQKMATGAAVGPLQHGDRRCRRAFTSLRRRQRLSPKPRTPVARAQQRHFHFSVCTHKSWRRGNTWDRNTFLRKSNVPYGV